MKGVTDDSRRAAYARILLGLLAALPGMFYALANFGAGNWPLGGLLAVAPLYLLGILVLDIRSAFTKGYRARPSYMVWWLLAAIPTATWLVWLKLGS